MAVGSEEVFIILLIIILIISVVLGVYPVFSRVAKNKCILQQHTLLNAFDKMIELVKERNAPIENHSFLVMGCTECMWYDSLNSQWIIKHEKEEWINKSVSYNVIGVAANCVDCNMPEKCANMIKDNTYNFEVGTDYVKCTNCPSSPNLCDYPILFSPRVDVVNDPVEQKPIALVSYKNILYLFYNKKGIDDIYYKTSTDGKNWNPEVMLTDSAHTYGYPSAYVFNDDLYVAYSGNIGDPQIFIRKFDGTNWGNADQLTSININSAPNLAAYMGKLYIFYSHSDSINSNIRYRICNNNCDSSGNWGSEQEATDWGGKKESSPSAFEYNGKLHLSYSAGAVIWDIYYKTCDDTNICDGQNKWSSEEQITHTQATDRTSSFVLYNDVFYLFYYHSELIIGFPSVQEDIIWYKAYDSGWQKECGAAGGQGNDRTSYPAIAIHWGKLILCYLKYDTDWRIVCQ